MMIAAEIQTDTFSLILSGIAGMAIGLLYFGGLWLTIRQLPQSRHPVLLMMSSLIVRTAITVGAFYYVMNQHWERAIACLIGFIAIRMILASRLHPGRLPLSPAFNDAPRPQERAQS